jgi:hypothetical protein
LAINEVGEDAVQLIVVYAEATRFQKCSLVEINVAGTMEDNVDFTSNFVGEENS